MIEINLLPHREAKRAAELRQTLALLVVGLVLEAGVIFYMNSDVQVSLSSAQAQVRQLESDIERFKPQQEQVDVFKAKRDQLEEKLAVIDDLDRQRSGPIRLMDELANQTPERLWLTSLVTEGKTILMSGQSLDNDLVALFLRSLGESAYFTDVDLDKTEMRDTGGLRLMNFRIRAELANPAPNASAEAA